jgi:hypothetical protein
MNKRDISRMTGSFTNWKFDKAYNQPSGTTMRAPVPMATREVHQGMNMTPDAVMAMMMVKDVTKSAKYHHRGTSGYARCKTLS